MSEEERPEAGPEKPSVREPETASGRLRAVAVKNRESGPSSPLGDFDKSSGGKDRSRTAETHPSRRSAFSLSLPPEGKVKIRRELQIWRKNRDRGCVKPQSPAGMPQG
jgi:hypothetical protein